MEGYVPSIDILVILGGAMFLSAYAFVASLIEKRNKKESNK